jgi:protein O-GlcNAc transferase
VAGLVSAGFERKMKNVTIQEAFDLALQHHEAGRLRDAEQIYRQIVAVYPRHGDALHNLGVIARQAGQHTTAADFFRRSIAVQPDYPDAYNNLGVVLRDLGQFADSIAACRQAIALRSSYAEAYFNLGLVLRDDGQRDQAMAAFHQAILCRVEYADAHTNLGISLAEAGKLDEAITSHRRAISLKPDHAQAHNNLGIALTEKEQFEEAIAECKQAIALRPNYAEAYNSLGNALKVNGDSPAAEAAYRQAVTLKPALVDGWINLAFVLQANHRLEESVAAYQKAIAVKPNNAEAYLGLGNVYRQLGQPHNAITAYRQACALKTGYVQAMSNLSATLVDTGNNEDAISICREAIILRPDYPDLHNNLSIALRETGQLDEAIAACKHALILKPGLPEALSNLADAYKERGDLDEAIASYRQAISLKGHFPEAHTSLVYAMNFDPDLEPQTIADEHRIWGRTYTDPLKNLIQPHNNDRNPDRRLRIGYVSPDFRGHPVATFFLPLLTAHDRKRFEIFCYSQVAIEDSITQKIRASADVFRSIVGLSDNAVAETIRQDQIDILVDLTGHTAGNRLLMFAQKPAPLQVTYLGYPATTGLDAIDYRITDAYADPPGMTEAYHSEKLIRLPHCAWCYQPLQPPPPVSQLPALSNNYITFGSFNNFSKVSTPALHAWAEILLAVPGSRLLIKGRGLRSESAQQKVRRLMSEKGVSPDRLTLRGWVPAAEHLSLYNQVDIALDTFPYNGTTTTCEAILMGVPVVALAGKSHVARVGVSLLSNLNLSDLAGNDLGQYIQIATELATDQTRLVMLRSQLREQMEQSWLMNSPQFARDVGAAYRQIWRDWCGMNLLIAEQGP